jgi:AcrR family transcriptional regulator
MAGRPREFDRDVALERARDLFWERGYEGVSIADLVNTLGLASARIYAAFGSKEELFREAIKLYESREGGFADRALAEEPAVILAVERVLREAIELYTRKRGPRGCMVVAAATNCSSANDGVRQWLVDRRRARTALIVKRIKKAVREGELRPDTDWQSLGDLCASVLHGISVQARDGVSRERLLAAIRPLIAILEATTSSED